MLFLLVGVMQSPVCTSMALLSLLLGWTEASVRAAEELVTKTHDGLWLLLTPT